MMEGEQMTSEQIREARHTALAERLGKTLAKTVARMPAHEIATLALIQSKLAYCVAVGIRNHVVNLRTFNEERHISATWAAQITDFLDPIRLSDSIANAMLLEIEYQSPEQQARLQQMNTSLAAGKVNGS